MNLAWTFFFSLNRSCPTNSSLRTFSILWFFFKKRKKKKGGEKSLSKRLLTAENSMNGPKNLFEILEGGGRRELRANKIEKTFILSFLSVTPWKVLQFFSLLFFFYLFFIFWFLTPFWSLLFFNGEPESWKQKDRY